MKVAIVHELLTTKGGAERVAKVFANMFPEADIFTLLYNEEKLGDWFPKDRVIPAKLPFPHSLLPSFNHHLYLRHFPKAVEAWDFRGYDLVLSSNSAFVHGIRTNGSPPHLCYVHSPARYLWDATHDVLERANAGPLGVVKRAYLERLFHKLRIWDSEVAPRPDKLLAASAEVQRRIELYWRRESDVLHPPVDDAWFSFADAQDDTKHVTPSPSSGSGQASEESYFLIVSTLSRYKQIDLAVEACNQLQLPLKIVGEGPDKSRLQKLAGPTVEFLGFKDQDELKVLYSDAEAVIFPGHEDFGLVPVEAMACGTPVIGRRIGGALESIVEGKTGLFFGEPTAESLANTIRSFDANAFIKDICQAHAQKFRRAEFEAAINNHINQLLPS